MATQHGGPEFVAKAVQDWIAAVGAKTAYSERGSPWENGYSKASMPVCGTSCSKTLREAQIVIESWRRHYNAVHGTNPPGPGAIVFLKRL
jgi:putative transposase